MRTKTITVGGQSMRVDYPDALAFMYSRQPVLVVPANADGPLSVVVTHTASGRTHTETRDPLGYEYEFDISRIMQLLAPDLDEITQKFGSLVDDLSQSFTLSIAYDGETAALGTTKGIYGAKDALDEPFGDIRRRLWVNFPQTFAVWKDGDGDVKVDIEKLGLSFALSGEGECLLLPAIGIRFEPAVKEEIISMPVVEVTTTAPPSYGTRKLTLIPDHSTAEDGTYLRWVNRQGGMSYWLFKNSRLRTTSALRDSFQRFYSGDPSAAVDGIFRNPQKASYSEAREMVLGAVGLVLEEYEDLCSLATSPVVERYVPTASGSERWQRVNVTAGTFERDIRFNTPSLQDLEVVIELPERNTVTL